MRGITILTLIIILIACSAESKQVELKNHQDSISYALGLQLGINFTKDSVFLNTEAFRAGMHQAMYGDTNQAQITMLEQKQLLLNFQNEMQQRLQQKQASGLASTKLAGAQFLEKNKTQPGVKTTKSGLQYKVIEEGDGLSPTPQDTVIVHYKGTLVDGTVFDSSIDRGQPAKFPVGGVIPGWIEGLQLMKEGGKYMLYIPSDLAYGDRQAGPTIPAGSTLIFEVNLIKVIKPKK